MTITLQTVPFDKKAHSRDGFSSGEDALDDFIKKTARQHMDAHLSMTYVYTEGSEIIGYYTLSFDVVTVPEGANRKVKNYQYPAPVAKIARLAIDKLHQKKGFGELLLFDALMRIYQGDKAVPVIGAFVDSKTDAVNFYKKLGFVETETKGDGKKLWLPIESIINFAESE